MGKEEIWNTWGNIHNTPDALSRIESAKKADLTPLEINVDSFFGHFQGRHGKYETFLDHCPCGDFRRRKLPCKHIYRLAMELHLINDEVDTNKAKIRPVKTISGYSFEETINIIEQLSDEAQKVMLDCLRVRKTSGIYQFGVENNSYTNELINKHIFELCENEDACLSALGRNELNTRISKLNIPFKKNMKKDVLIQWCHETIPDKIHELCDGLVAIELNSSYQKAYTKVLTYLLRKYEPELYYNPDLDDMVTYMPDDEITAMLQKYTK